MYFDVRKANYTYALHMTFERVKNKKEYIFYLHDT